MNTIDTLCLVCGAHHSTKSKLGSSPQWFSPLACRRHRVRASPPARCWSTRTSANTAPAGTGPPNCAHRTEKKKIFKKSAVFFVFFKLGRGADAPPQPDLMHWGSFECKLLSYPVLSSRYVAVRESRMLRSRWNRRVELSKGTNIEDADSEKQTNKKHSK